MSESDEKAARKALGERLKRARIESGSRAVPARDVSKAWVGRQLAVTGVAVGLWESGANEPTRATLERLADLYGCELLWLTFGRGPMYAPKPPTASDVLNHFPNVVPGATESADAFFARKAREEADDEANRQKPGGRRGKGA